MSYLMFVPNFKILGQVIPEKTLTENFPLHCIGVKEGKNKKWKKKAKIKIRILIFLYTIYFATLKLHTKFEDPGSNGS